LSTGPGAQSPAKPSAYQAVFKQGATIVPRSFYFIRGEGIKDAPDPATQYWVETDPEQAAEAKKPYDDIHLKGLVEGRFIYTSAISRHVLPYAHLTPANVVLPVVETNGSLTMVTADKMTREGYREFAKWMKNVEKLWADRRGEKSGKQTAYERLDYSGGITAQNLRQRHLVLYNAAGTNVSATYFDRGQHPRFVVEHKLYWAALANADEAHYLVAILNSETANQAIKPFQSTGLLGERDIEKKLLELPIPTFNQEKPKHRRISELGAKAHEEAVKAIRSGEFPVDSAIARQRRFMRDHLKSELEEIDKLVAALLS